jgi:hypothetical protein
MPSNVNTAALNNVLQACGHMHHPLKRLAGIINSASSFIIVDGVNAGTSGTDGPIS